MITEIRDGFKQRGFKIVLWFMLLSMVVVFIPNLFKGDGFHVPVATINNKNIELIDYERRLYQETERYNMLRQQLGAQADLYLKALGMGDPKTMAIGSLIQEALLDQEAAKIGIVVSPEFIREKLQDFAYITQDLGDVIPFYVLDQHGVDITRLNYYLAQQRLTMQDFEDRIENKIKRSVLLTMLEAAVYVPKAQISDYYKRHYLGREYSVVELPFDKYLKKAQEKSLTDDEITQYFEKENKKYWAPETRSISLFTFDPKSYDSTVSDKDIENYYNAHKNQFIETPLQVQVRRILVEVNNLNEKAAQEAENRIMKIKKDLEANPQSFEELARQFSDDKKSAAQGGLLDSFKKGDHDPEFERAAFRLQKDGDISDVVHTSEGMEIIQRVTRTPATYKLLKTVENKIKDILYNQKFKSKFTEDTAKIISTTTKEKVAAAFAQFVQQKQAKSDTIENMKNDGSPLSTKIFKARQGDWISLIADGKGVVAQVTAINKSHKPEIAEVKKLVEKDVYQLQAHTLIKNDMAQIQAQTTGSLKEKFPLVTVEKTSMVKAQDQKDLAQLEKTGITPDQLASLDHIDATTVLFNNQNGYFIKVTKVDEFSQESLDAQKSSIMRILSQEQKQALLKGFIASLYRNAKIKLTQSLLTLKEETNL